MKQSKAEISSMNNRIASDRKEISKLQDKIEEMKNQLNTKDQIIRDLKTSPAFSNVIGVFEPSDEKLVEACHKYYEMKYNYKFSSPVKQSIIESWIEFYRFIYKEAQK